MCQFKTYVLKSPLMIHLALDSTINMIRRLDPLTSLRHKFNACQGFVSYLKVGGTVPPKNGYFSKVGGTKGGPNFRAPKKVVATGCEHPSIITI